MRSIKHLHQAEYAPIADLVTYRVLPVRTLQYLDPFLFLNHHGPQVYSKNNNGLPFGPHPHRGMETVTFILEGDISHKDNGGYESTIAAGGVQWMTAGSGLIHSEASSASFKKNGGPLEILQLWVNLPAHAKMTKPFYKGLQKEYIPSLIVNGEITVNLIAGHWEGYQGAFQSEIGLQLNTIYFNKNATLSVRVPKEHNIFFYVIGGSLKVNGTTVQRLHLAEFDRDGEILNIRAEEQSVLLFGHAQPLGEPVVAQGPFVMNTEEEIHQAYEDYHSGKFGGWRE